MPERFEYHFEPQKGWMNDPNGLIEFNGQYHAFFQHNPYAPVWGPMHWGHAVSKDLLHWEEVPIALKPEETYENSGGCFSGSAIEKDGKLYLFYTSVSKELGQTQSVAVSEDGIHFKKYKGNPVISYFPEEGSADFRDPKVSLIDGIYYMVVGSVLNKKGRVLLYTSEDLYNWQYLGVLYESVEYNDAIECPDFFKLGDKYVLMYSKINYKTHATQFVIGDFDGRKLIPEAYSTPEAGPQFYAPQTFESKDGRRIMIGWFYNWGRPLDEGAGFAGALSIPRELTICNGKIYNFPVKEAQDLLKKEAPEVWCDEKKCILKNVPLENGLEYRGEITSVDILKDKKAIEVFINKGEASFSYWLSH